MEEQRAVPMTEELEDMAPAVLAEMVRNLQVRMIGMEREVSRGREATPPREDKPKDRTLSPARDRRVNVAARQPSVQKIPGSFQGYTMEENRDARSLKMKVESQIKRV
jgi:hypothetical protein